MSADGRTALATTIGRLRSSFAGRAGAAFGALLVCAFTASAALSQPSPPPDDAKCNVIVGGKGVNDGRTVFPQAGSFRVEGSPGCVAPNADVHVEADNDRSRFATFRAQRDGSFRSPSITLPKHLTLGPRRLVPRVPEALPVPVRPSRGPRGSVPISSRAPLQREPVTEIDALDEFLGAR